MALFLCRLLMQSHFGKAQAGRNDPPHEIGAAACGISPGCAAQLASSLRCSVHSRGRSSSVRRVAVNSTGCRLCKIASTSSGLEGKTNFLGVEPARRGCLKPLKPAEAAKVPVGAMLPPGGTGIALWEPLGSGTKMVSRGLVWRTRAG